MFKYKFLSRFWYVESNSRKRKTPTHLQRIFLFRFFPLNNSFSFSLIFKSWWNNFSTFTKHQCFEDRRLRTTGLGDRIIQFNSHILRYQLSFYHYLHCSYCVSNSKTDSFHPEIRYLLIYIFYKHSCILI